MLRPRTATGIAVGLICAASLPARGDVELPLQEELWAKRAIQSLRDAGRTLKRLSRDAEPAYARWLGQASEDVLGLAGRWASALDYFGRDFPHDALRADPERLAYARQWLRERNAELSAQSDELVARLLAANDGFRGGADAERLAAARKTLEGVRTHGPSARRSSAIAIASSS